MPEPRTPLHCALQHPHTAGRAYPGRWKQYDRFRQDRDAMGGWPDYVYCPLAGSYAIVSGRGGNPFRPGF